MMLNLDGYIKTLNPRKIL